VSGGRVELRPVGDEHRLVAEFLKLAQFFQHHGVPEVDVRRGRVDTELRPQRPPRLELLQQFFRTENLVGAGDEGGELLFW